MIAITPEIIGPGIEEEYADAMERIEVLLRILEPFPCSNDTPEGSLHYQVLWFRQEIEAGRLPIPLDRKYRGTLCYLIGSCKIDYLPGIETPMGKLNVVLEGTGLIKPRHYPVVISLIDDLLEMIGNPPGISDIEKLFLSEALIIRNRLAENSLRLPLNKGDYPGWKGIPREVNLKRIFPNLNDVRWPISEALFAGWRPTICRKGPLAPPNPTELAWAGEIKGKPQGQA